MFIEQCKDSYHLLISLIAEMSKVFVFNDSNLWIKVNFDELCPMHYRDEKQGTRNSFTQTLNSQRSGPNEDSNINGIVQFM